MAYQYHADITDTDLYKFSMQQGYLFKYPSVQGRYGLITRKKTEYPDGFAKRLVEIVDSFRGLQLKKSSKEFLQRKAYYLSPAYLDFLQGYRYDPSEMKIEQRGPDLSVDAQGYLYRTVLWETPVMETISELYFEMTGQKPFSDIQIHNINREKAIGLALLGALYSEFGSRRRFSYLNQKYMIQDFIEHGKGNMIGTSNVHFAEMFDLTPMGTVAHEWFMLHAALFGYLMANPMALEAWVDIYKGDLGIALTDTFTTDVFFKAFNTKFAKLFDGVRQDSYDPLVFVEKAVAHYQKLRINPLFKTSLFSDNIKSLDAVKAIRDACKGRIIDRFGIGTWLSNDVGVIPLNIVFKLLAVNAGYGWLPTVKLSDDPAKHTGDNDTAELCKKTLGLN